jgi:hypothetical protein
LSPQASPPTVTLLFVIDDEFINGRMIRQEILSERRAEHAQMRTGKPSLDFR